MYESVVNEIRRQYAADKVKDGEFGAYMNVSLTNDGPVTYELESRSKDQQ